MKKNLVLAAIFCAIGLAAQAQTDTIATTTAGGISDDELKRYAVMMDSIDGMRSDLLSEVAQMIKTSELMSVNRYNELIRIKDDTAKLAAVNATPEEMAFLEEIRATRQKGSQEISQVFQSMANDYVGSDTYSKVRRALTTNDTVKSKYKSMLDEIKQDHGG